MAENEQPTIKLNALVVDDSRVMRSLVMKALNETELAEFDFIEAGSGSEAIDKFDADKANIIFVDWNMPGMDGIEFARQIRSMHWANHIPIVMITSESGSEKQQNAYDRARITCYVTKPFTAEEIKEKLGPVIDNLVAKGHVTVTQPVAQATNQSAKQGGFFTSLLN